MTTLEALLEHSDVQPITEHQDLNGLVALLKDYGEGRVVTDRTDDGGLLSGLVAVLIDRR